MHNRRFSKQITLSLWNVRCIEVFYLNKKHSVFILAPPNPVFFLEGNTFPWMSHLVLENFYSLYLAIHSHISAHVFDSHPISVHLWRGSGFILSASFGQMLIRKVCLRFLLLKLKKPNFLILELSRPNESLKKILLSRRLGFRLEEPSTTRICITHFLDRILYAIPNNLKEKNYEYALKGGQRWNKNL